MEVDKLCPTCLEIVNTALGSQAVIFPQTWEAAKIREEFDPQNKKKPLGQICKVSDWQIQHLNPDFIPKPCQVEPRIAHPAF